MVIYLNDRNNYIFSGLGQGLLQGLNAGLNFGVRDYFANKQFQNQLKRLDKLYDLQTQKAKDLAKYKYDLENEQRKRLVRELLGQQAQVENLNQSFDVGDIRQDILTGIDRAKQQGFDLFGAEGGLLNQAIKNMPQLNLPKPEVKTKYKGGVLSEYANQSPLIADSIKAQVYGIKLPEKKETTFVMSDPIKTVDEKGNPIWKIAKMNKATGEVQYETIPMAREYKKGSIKVSESKPFIGEDGKAYFYREYLFPNGKIKRKKLRYYDSKEKGGSKSGKGRSFAEFNQLFGKFLNLRKQLRLLETGRMIDDVGNVMQIPEGLKAGLQQKIKDELVITFELMKMIDPEKAKIIEERMYKEPLFNDVLPMTPANREMMNNKETQERQKRKNPPKKTYNPFEIFEVK